MKMLRENESGYRIEPIGAGLGNWVIAKIEGDADQVCKQPNDFGRAVKLRQILSLAWGRFNPRCTYAIFFKVISRD